MTLASDPAARRAAGVSSPIVSGYFSKRSDNIPAINAPMASDAHGALENAWRQGAIQPQHRNLPRSGHLPCSSAPNCDGPFRASADDDQQSEPRGSAGLCG